MEIEDTRAQELFAAEARLKDLEPQLATVTAEAAKVAPLETKVEAAELATKAAEDAAAAEKEKREQLEEAARTETLAADRTGKLGKAFLAKLTDGIKAKLTEQAKTLSDEDWTARLDELAELTGVKADEDGSAEGDADVLTGEETARAGGGGLGGGTSPTDGQAPSQVARTAVLGKLVDILP